MSFDIVKTPKRGSHNYNRTFVLLSRGHKLESREGSPRNTSRGGWVEKGKSASLAMAPIIG
jgi:hypothetical protein